jgi:hypothetical protein
MTMSRKPRSLAAPLEDPQALARLYGWIAALFFATGFLGYFVVYPL